MTPHDEFNPYATPSAAPRESPRPVPNGTIATFAVLNAVAAAACLLWVLAMGVAAIYGIFFSGDEGAELATGILGVTCLGSPALLGLVLFLAATVGLARRRAWGYSFHLAGAALAAFTCVGLPYSIAAFIFALRPEFLAAFFPPRDEASAD